MKSNEVMTGSKRLLWSSRLSQLNRDRNIYIFLLPGLLYYIIFCYVPIWGIMMAFQRFEPFKGILGSQWIGLENFRFIFKDADFWSAFSNTVVISAGKILFCFTTSIVLALLINELVFSRMKRVLQTIYTFPHFLSWIVVSSLVFNILNSTGAANRILTLFGCANIQFMAEPGYFKAILFGTEVWKEIGWSSIIYLASITSIDPMLYEAAVIDGANRLQRIIYITLPGIKQIILLLLLLAIGNSMNAGFDQVFNMYNPMVYSTGDIIDTFIYRITFLSPLPDFGVSTAAGLFKSVINFVLLFTADRVAKMFGERGIF